MEAQLLEKLHTRGYIALFVMELENRVLNSTQKVSIILNKQQLGSFDIAL